MLLHLMVVSSQSGIGQRDQAPPAVKPRPPFFRALGKKDPPPVIRIGAAEYRFVKLFKHDSWAASALYDSGAERVVCKFNRSHPIGILPVGWLGRRLGRREADFLALLSDIELVPRLKDPVRVEGKIWLHAVAHQFIPGHPMGRTEPLAPLFFEQLHSIIERMHQRGIAYVDLHKRENIIVGDDGRPHLVDFQISCRLPHGWIGDLSPVKRWFEFLKQSDLYHLMKHTMRHQLLHLPDGLREQIIREHRPANRRLIRRIANRLRGWRRRLLVAVGIRSGKGLAVTEHEPEEGVREESPAASAPAR